MPNRLDESGLKFGPLQGLWLMLGYLAAQLLGNVLAYAVWGVGLSVTALLHGHKLPARYLPGTAVLAWAMLLGFAASALWTYFYIRRGARPLLHRGEATGIGWCKPRRRRAYLMAVVAALLAVLFAALIVALLPPDPEKLKGPMSKLLAAPGLPRLSVTLLAIFGAPLVEEVLFRGALFAALARRWSVPVSGTVTTLVFVALHAPDKLGWWPGFLVVGVLGALLLLMRIRYRSLWPGMLTHFLYNSSFFFLP